jgi:hypothetical protein
MITLATTRFNTQTWAERERWLERKQWSGCIYGTTVRANPALGPMLIVLEMHNDDNEIKAVSLVRNSPVSDDKSYQIYSDYNYNRYIYKSPYRIVFNQIELTLLEKKIIAIFNQLLFKGACHLKRSHGITAVPDWIMKNRHIDFIKYFKEMFKRGCSTPRAPPLPTS